MTSRVSKFTLEIVFESKEIEADYNRGLSKQHGITCVDTGLEHTVERLKREIEQHDHP